MFFLKEKICLNFEKINVVFAQEKKLVNVRLLYLNENSDTNDFVFLLGFEEGDFLKFRLQFLIRKIKERIKMKTFSQENPEFSLDFIMIEVFKKNIDF